MKFSNGHFLSRPSGALIESVFSLFSFIVWVSNFFFSTAYSWDQLSVLSFRLRLQSQICPIQITDKLANVTKFLLEMSYEFLLVLQTAHDHSSLLILVRHLGSRLSSRTFSRLYERISRQNSFKIQDSSGCVRNIYTRYVRTYPTENNDWGDFQVMD